MNPKWRNKYSSINIRKFQGLEAECAWVVEEGIMWSSFCSLPNELGSFETSASESGTADNPGIPGIFGMNGSGGNSNSGTSIGSSGNSGNCGRVMSKRRRASAGIVLLMQLKKSKLVTRNKGMTKDWRWLMAIVKLKIAYQGLCGLIGN